MSDSSKMLPLAYKIKDLYDGLLAHAKVRGGDEARVSASICLTISEQFAATLCLVERGFSSHAPVMVRSMLEGLADLCNIVNNASYLDQIRFENARQDCLLFDGFAADQEMKEDASAIATLQNWKSQAVSVRDELAGKGYKKQQVEEKFKTAGISTSYTSYRMLCSFAHNQLTTILARHDGNPELRYHEEAPPEATASTLTVAANILTQAISTLSSYTDLRTEELNAVIHEANELWRKMQDLSKMAEQLPS